MIYRIDHDYHIHTKLSSCSKDEEQTVGRIVEYARKYRLERVCITDHFWDEGVLGASPWYRAQNLAHISKSKPFPDTRVTKILFGCEGEMRRDKVVGIGDETYSKFDFVIIPTTHLHMDGFTIDALDIGSTKRRAELWCERLEALFDMALPFRKIGIAHLACPLLARDREAYLEVLRQIPSERMADIFEKAARLGVGIEINKSDMSYSDPEESTVLRIFRIARSVGCKFYLGSDAHHPSALDEAGEVFERAIRRLDLLESDKFHIGE